ncbi:hypothetical protein KSP39_PZI010631 [Platanthera zijinensis]|uniref:Uncharacterized protein n=1 Tax=Platanthera zijinensis TaxID=2320716 RepID=A0AAP0BJC6_9ASPA
MALSRYLFALSCFQINLLWEAEIALCPANELNLEIPNGASGHHLLGLIYSQKSMFLKAVTGEFSKHPYRAEIDQEQKRSKDGSKIKFMGRKRKIV